MIDTAVFNSVATPCYLFDIDALRDHTQALRRRFGQKSHICYAMKANPFIVSALADIVDTFEVCSPGEFRICEAQKIDPKQILVSGVYKNAKDLERYVSVYGSDLTYSVESLSQWEMLSHLAMRYHCSLKVYLRLSSKNQFGMDQQDIEWIVKHRHESVYLSIEGLHYFSGTQKTASGKYMKEFLKLKTLMVLLNDEYGLKDLRLEYGPGLPVDYYNREVEGAHELVESLSEAIDASGFTGMITLEMGRYISAYCGYYVTAVVDTKKVNAENYAIVDGGIHQVTYYGQTLGLKQPLHFVMNSGSELRSWTVFGALCTINDILLRQVELPDLVLGSRLVFERAGSYSVTEGIALFLSRDLPVVYSYQSGQGLRCLRDVIETDQLNCAVPIKER